MSLGEGVELKSWLRDREHTIRGYRERGPRAYPASEGGLTGPGTHEDAGSCAHLRIVKPPSDPEKSLRAALSELTTDAFYNRLALMRPGLERRMLAEDPAVQKLVQALPEYRGAREMIEETLDHLFEELSTGEVFPYEETVIAILFALDVVGATYLSDIASVFAKSKTVEISRIRRFASRLLQ